MFKVTNGNTFDFTAKFSGVPYTFPKGQAVLLPEDAARHIFVIGDPNKAPYFSRHGWALPSENLDRGHKILAAFKFEAAQVKYEFPLAAEVANDDHGAAPVAQEPEVAKGTDGPKAASGGTGLPGARKAA